MLFASIEKTARSRVNRFNLWRRSIAYRVIVWLGKEAADTEGALEEYALLLVRSLWSAQKRKLISKQSLIYFEGHGFSASG
jgi:hypothetical protein